MLILGEQNQKLVDIAINGDMAAHLIGDTGVESADDCTAKGNGHLWLNANGNDHCFYMTTLNGGRGSIGGGCTDDPLDCGGALFNPDVGDSFYDAMTKQGIDLEVRSRGLCLDQEMVSLTSHSFRPTTTVSLTALSTVRRTLTLPACHWTAPFPVVSLTSQLRLLPGVGCIRLSFFERTGKRTRSGTLPGGFRANL